MALAEAPQGSTTALAELERRLRGWQPDQVGTLLFLREAGQVLLIRKLRGHGAGKINGPGGKPEPGESPLHCALRETREEVGVHVTHAELRARFRFLDTEQADWQGFIFVADRYQGTPRPSAEALPLWYPLDALPFDEMWDDDRFWLPRVLSGERLHGDFLFNAGTLAAHRLERLAADETFDQSFDASFDASSDGSFDGSFNDSRHRPR